MSDSQSSYPTVKEWLKNVEWVKEIEESINPLTGEKTKLHHYILSLEIGSSCSISEEDEKKAPEALKHMRETMEYKIEEYIDKLVFNKIKQQNKGGFHESVHAYKPVVVLHPKYIGDIIRDGFFMKPFGYHTSPHNSEEKR